MYYLSYLTNKLIYGLHKLSNGTRQHNMQKLLVQMVCVCPPCWGSQASYRVIQRDCQFWIWYCSGCISLRKLWDVSFFQKFTEPKITYEIPWDFFPHFVRHISCEAKLIPFSLRQNLDFGNFFNKWLGFVRMVSHPKTKPFDKKIIKILILS